MPIPKVAFGPVCKNPSWRWVGFDTARELSKYFDVEFFTSYECLPEADVVMCVKQIPSPHFVDFLSQRNVRLIYAPIDVFQSPTEILNNSRTLRKCDLLVVHSERLLPFISHYAPVVYMDHHAKFTLPEMSKFKKDGYVLWVGHLSDVPWLLSALRAVPLNRELRILTRLNPSSLPATNRLARELGLDDVVIDNGRVNSYRAFNWSERAQFEMMSECKAAIDVKGTSLNFNQLTKPATKIQKYITSGIPSATNAGAYSADYFLALGFTIAAPSEQERWFSEAYWEHTRAIGIALRNELSIEVIGAKYRDLIEALVGGLHVPLALQRK